MTVFFTSDTHFGHANIIKFCNRPFRDIDHMDEELIRRWNATVTPDDTVYHLGDVALGSRERWGSRLSRLNGTIYLVPGNHDRCSSVMSKNKDKRMAEAKAYQKYGFAGILDDIEEIIMPGIGHINICHYPFRGQNRDKDFRQFDAQPEDVGVPLIHGHTHSSEALSFSDSGTPMVHVGVDAWDYRPVSEWEIKSLLDSTGKV